MALISTYWGPVRPLRHHFRTVSAIVLKVYLRNRSMLSLSAKDRQKDPRSIAPKVTLDDREECFTLECVWGKSCCGYSFMETTGHCDARRQD